MEKVNFMQIKTLATILLDSFVFHLIEPHVNLTKKICKNKCVWPN